MDDLGFNKIAGAVLATGLGMMLLMKLPGVFLAHADESIAYKVGTISGPTTTEPVVDLPFPQQDWIDAMDAAKGAKAFKVCKSCHNAKAGGANGTGPALYGIVGNDIAAQSGYKYSTSLTGLAGNWDYEALDAFLKKPKLYAPGTQMNYQGVKQPEKRAAIIEYLRLADPAPEPRPTTAAVEAVTPTEVVEAGVVPTQETGQETGEPIDVITPDVPAELIIEPKEPAEAPH